MGAALALSLQHGVPWAPPSKANMPGNPLVNTYKTKDDRHVSLCCLQAAKYWPDACKVLGRPELTTDERFADPEGLRTNAHVAIGLLAEAFAEHTAAEWRERLADFSGQWAMVQDTLEVAVDPQTIANGYVRDYETSEGVPFQLAAPPVTFGGEPSTPRRAPDFNEHGDAILEGLGIDWDTIVDLKVRGVVA